MFKMSVLLLQLLVLVTTSFMYSYGGSSESFQNNKSMQHIMYSIPLKVDDASDGNTNDTLSDDFLDSLTSIISTWKAGRNFDPTISMDYIYGLMGARVNVSFHKLSLWDSHLYAASKMPASFDTRKKWNHCSYIPYIADQGPCGSCWAVAVATVFSDRLCIHSAGNQNLRLSYEDLLSCCRTCGSGCKGGYPEAAWDYLVKTGIVSGGPYGSKEGCQPYSIESCDHQKKGTKRSCDDSPKTPACKHSCKSYYKVPYKRDLHYASKRYSVPSNEEKIRKEIYENGPVTACFTVYKDFMYYKSGVYQHKKGQSMGGHAVRMIGWGKENGVPYWLIANSWGKNWGDGGTFKIRRGNNECGIEDYVTGGIPKLK